MQWHRNDHIGIGQNVRSGAHHHTRHKPGNFQPVAIFEAVGEGARAALITRRCPRALKTGGLAMASADRIGPPRSTAKGRPRRSQKDVQATQARSSTGRTMRGGPQRLSYTEGMRADKADRAAADAGVKIIAQSL